MPKAGLPNLLKSDSICITVKNFDELVQLKNYLEELKISCGVIHNPSRKHDPNFWRFYIAAKSYAKFATIIGSKHPDKSEILRMKI